MIYCRVCEHYTDLQVDGDRCDAPENQKTIICKSDYRTPSSSYIVSDQLPRELNAKNDCPYFKPKKKSDTRIDL